MTNMGLVVADIEVSAEESFGNMSEYGPWGTIVTFVADKKGILANIWGIRGVEEGGKPNAGAWTEVRWLKRSGWQIYGVREVQ